MAFGKPEGAIGTFQRVMKGAMQEREQRRRALDPLREWIGKQEQKNYDNACRYFKRTLPGRIGGFRERMSHAELAERIRTRNIREPVVLAGYRVYAPLFGLEVVDEGMRILSEVYGLGFHVLDHPVRLQEQYIDAAVKLALNLAGRAEEAEMIGSKITGPATTEELYRRVNKLRILYMTKGDIGKIQRMVGYRVFSDGISGEVPVKYKFPALENSVSELLGRIGEFSEMPRPRDNFAKVGAAYYIIADVLFGGMRGADVFGEKDAFNRKHRLANKKICSALKLKLWRRIGLLSEEARDYRNVIRKRIKRKNLDIRKLVGDELVKDVYDASVKAGVDKETVSDVMHGFAFYNRHEPEEALIPLLFKAARASIPDDVKRKKFLVRFMSPMRAFFYTSLFPAD